MVRVLSVLGKECIITRPIPLRAPLIRAFLVVSTALALSAALLVAPADAKTPKKPSKITSLTVAAGGGPGHAVVRWKTKGKNTDYFVLETGLTAFSPTKKSLPRHGRHSRTFTIGGKARAFEFTPARAAYAGAPLGSGRHIYIRLFAVNRDGSKTRNRPFAKERSVLLQGLPKAAGVVLRAATFNIRTARATDDARNWLTRAPDVAAEIKIRRPSVVMLQELGPGRADGKSIALGTAQRQTTSLLSALQRAGVTSYRLVRTTGYIKPGTTHGTQGARILYDTSRIRLLTDCPETTSGSSWNPSCSFNLPILGSNENERRRAAYAEFAETKSGKRFFAVSAHLDSRHSSNTTTERRLNTLRGQQAAAAVNGVARVNVDKVPVIFGGDVNSWQANRVGYAPHDALVYRGFVDSAAAALAYNLKYSTVNHFARTMKRSGTYGSRLDLVMAKGAKGINRYENKLAITSTRRPSDHNMVLGDVVL